jgi:hypothetical protein
MYEASIRVPFLMRYPPLISAGTSVSRIVLNLDLAPTVLELAGVKIPESVQGLSLVGLFDEDRTEPWRTDFLYEYFEHPTNDAETILGIRNRRYKLITYPGSSSMSELYDLKSDPEERANLILERKAKRRLDELSARLEALEKETGFSFPNAEFADVPQEAPLDVPQEDPLGAAPRTPSTDPDDSSSGEDGPEPASDEGSGESPPDDQRMSRISDRASTFAR